jgi:hypothetical protein
VRFLTALIVCASGSVTGIESGQQETEPYLPDTVHRENGVVWRSGVQAADKPYRVSLVNDSQRPIQCRVMLGEIAPG